MQDSTVLHCAAVYGHADVAELLLSEGADVHAKDIWVSLLLL